MPRRRLENPREHLRAAALTQFAEHGLDGVTVAEIAAAAGMSERTFFRYFTDKREVVFAGEKELEQIVVAEIARIAQTTDGELDPLTVVARALDAAAGFFPDERRPQSRTRRTVIQADPSLRERELLKLASLAEAMAATLRQKGVDATTAALAADTGVTVFRAAHARWIAPGETSSLAELQRSLFDTLRFMIGRSRPAGAGAGDTRLPV